MKDVLTLQQRIAELEQLLEKEKQRSLKKDEKIAYLYEQFRLAQQKRFGKKAETYEEQLDLFNEAEDILAQIDEIETQEQTISYSRKKPIRQSLPKNLPREQVIHDVEDKTCDCCGNEMHKMGEDKSEKLVFIPATVKVQEYIRPKYACRHCEKNETSTPIKQAKMPAMPIEKGIATASLLSQIITSKYQFGLPLYRQEAMFKQHGIDLSRKTMSQWMQKSAALLAPLAEQLRAELLQQPVIFADETPLKVINSDKTKDYMWLYGSGADSPTQNNVQNIVLYEHQASRAASCPVNYLQGYQGYLQVDGYAAYEKTQAQLAGCWAHARRYFIDAKKLQGQKTGRADVVLSFIQKLYAIESRIKEKSTEEKYIARQAFSVPLLNELEQWLNKNLLTLVGKTKISEAINYLQNQWGKLIRYVEDGRINIDNNRAERAIKPFVIGRKNWLFSNTANGAKASATLYSIVETAKANGLIPHEYITICLEKLCQPNPDMNALLPWNFKK